MRCWHLAILMFGSFVHGTEIDSFSLRDPNLKDATFELSKLMNKYIKESIDEANSWNQCDPEAFRTSVHKRIGGMLWSTIEYDIAKNTIIEKRTISRAESIYKYVSFFDGPALYMAKLGHVLRMQDYYIGGDKLGHFIEEGYNYYNIIHRQHGTVGDALLFGEKAELGHFGLTTTGVYSYADLAANWQGYNEFWRVLIGTGADAFVSCKKGRYRSKRDFNWADHINASWDEAINCNRYRNEEMAKAVSRQITVLGNKQGVNLSCPIAPWQCPSMIRYFGDLAPLLISKACFEPN